MARKHSRQNAPRFFGQSILGTAIIISMILLFQNCGEFSSGINSSLKLSQSSSTSDPGATDPNNAQPPHFNISNIALQLGERRIVPVYLFNIDKPYTVNWTIVDGGTDFINSAGSFDVLPSVSETSFILQSSAVFGSKSYVLRLSSSDGTLPERSVTLSVTDPNTTVASSGAKLAVGGFSTCSISAGNVKCWGDNSLGQLGTGDTNMRTTPTNVTGLPVNSVESLAVGTGSVCAISQGAVYCWGNNANGQLGNGTNVNHLTPKKVTGLDSQVSSISAGINHFCAIKRGALYCWGTNNTGQLGIGNLTNSNVPVAVPGLSSGVTDVALGTYFTCAIQSGAVKCWGGNYAGQLGDGTTVDRLSPVESLSANAKIERITAGSNHVCVLSQGAVQCWGYNRNGQLGDGTITYRTKATPIPSLQSKVQQISAGGYHTCALVNGGVHCWGYNNKYYSAGNANTNIKIWTPTPVPSLTSKVTQIVSGANASHTCAIVDSKPVCWGRGDYGQIGVGNTSHTPTPVTPVSF